MSKNLVHEIVQNYREVGEEIGLSPSLERYAKHELAKFSIKDILEVFKSGPALMRAAGLIVPKNKYLDPEHEPKILCVDLEMLPMVLIGYGLYDQNFSVNQIMQNATLASFACGYVGEEKIEYFEVNWRRNPRDDKALTKKLHEKMSDADVILGQNSDAFDVKVANERFLEHDLGPSKPVEQIDTKKMAKNFFFPSRSLEYMSGRFCETKKMVNRKFHGIELQKACLAKNPEAWQEMREYNIIDVKATRELAAKFAPWYKKDLNAMKPGATFRCVNVLCGSTNIIQRGWKYQATGRFKQYTCNDCGKWFHEKGALNNQLSPAKRASLRGKP